MRSFRRLPLTLAACLAMALPGLMGGCVIQITPGGNGGNDNTTTPPQKITVRIVNEADTTLDPEVFVSATPATVDQLFAAGNKFTSFGVGTLGLLGPKSEDTVDVDCANVRVIGTHGGKFGNNLNAPDGTGQQIVLTQDLSIFCGGAVTFTFSNNGGFTTTYSVSR